MNSHRRYIRRGNGGQAMLSVVVFFLVAGLSLVLGSVSSLVPDIRAERDFSSSVQSYFTAEGGAEDAIIRIKKGLNPPTLYSFELGQSVAMISIDDIGGNEKKITVAGESGNVERKMNVSVTASEAGPFHYGIQVGDLGLTMSSNSIVHGNIYSNGMIVGASNSKIDGDAIAVETISSPDPEITGTITAGAQPASLPYVDVEYWKEQANINNDPYVGNMLLDGKLTYEIGPRKIVGNLTLDNNADVIVKGPLYVTGDFHFNSNAGLKLDESFGSNGTVVVVGGNISFSSNNAVSATTAVPRGYLLFYSESSSASAVILSSNAKIQAVIYAPEGTMTINSNASTTSVSAKKMILNSNATINYDTGLLNQQFTAGPAGGFDVKEWGEIE